MQTHEVKQFNWLFQMKHLRWCPGEVGLRYCHAPFPIELQLYCQFMWSTYAVNTHKCFSVCFTVWCVYRVPTEYRESEAW